MDLSTQDKTKIIFGGLFVIILLVGIIVGTILTQNRQAYRSQASETNLKVISPNQGENVSGIIGVSATASVNEKVSKLRGVLRVNNQDAGTFRIERNQGNAVLTTTLDIGKYEGKNHKLEIFLYDESNPTPLLIGQNSVNVTGK